MIRNIVFTTIFFAALVVSGLTSWNQAKLTASVFSSPNINTRTYVLVVNPDTGYVINH